MSSNSTPRKSHYNELDFEDIFQTITQLEESLVKNHRQDYKLRLALCRRDERVLDLKSCLRNEKERNKRLIKLILREDSETTEDDEEEKEIDKITNCFVKEPFEFISPLLMQQRYEDLSSSYNLCRKQLIKRDKDMKIFQGEKELLETKYDHLLDKYKHIEKRLKRSEEKNLYLKKIKNFKIHYLQNALNCATTCLLAAEKIIETLALDNKKLQPFKQEFQQNLQLFLNKLILNEWKYCNCQRIYESK